MYWFPISFFILARFIRQLVWTTTPKGAVNQTLNYTSSTRLVWVVKFFGFVVQRLWLNLAILVLTAAIYFCLFQISTLGPRYMAVGLTPTKNSKYDKKFIFYNAPLKNIEHSNSILSIQLSVAQYNEYPTSLQSFPV